MKTVIRAAGYMALRGIIYGAAAGALFGAAYGFLVGGDGVLIGGLFGLFFGGITGIIIGLCLGLVIGLTTHLFFPAPFSPSHYRQVITVVAGVATFVITQMMVFGLLGSNDYQLDKAAFFLLPTIMALVGATYAARSFVNRYVDEQRYGEILRGYDHLR